jgi:basic membrane protein A
MQDCRHHSRRSALRQFAVTAAGALAMTAITAGAGTADEPLRITYIYNYSAIDGGWAESFYNSQAYLADRFGGRVEVDYRENVPEGPQSRRIIEAAIQNGSDVIISICYGFGETMLQVAQGNPDVHFIVSQWDNPGNLDNVVGFENAPEEGAYVAGVAAGHIIEQGGLVGWVDAFPIPYDIRTINGFALGLAHANPDATMQVVFTNDWADRNLQARAARSLVTAGAKFIGTSVTGPATAEVAESAGLPVVTPALNGRQYAPTQLVTSYEYLWGPAIASIVESILNDSFSTEFVYADMSMGAVDMSPWGGAYDALSDEAKADIQAEYDRIRGGADLFVGPLSDSKGNAVLAAGEAMTVGALRGMNFVLPNVKGVDF